MIGISVPISTIELLSVGEGVVMSMIPQLGKFLLLIGSILAIIGVILILSGKLPWLGRLPGDFYFKGKHVSLYFPLTTQPDNQSHPDVHLLVTWEKIKARIL